MNYWVTSLKTKSYWRYAIFSRSALATILAVAGALYLFIEMLDFFSIYTRDKYSHYAFLVVILISVLATIFTRRPVTKVLYKIPGRDVSIEVLIGDLFAIESPLLISSSTTFDTDISDGTISPESLQGQLALKFFHGQTAEMDRQIDVSLTGVSFQEFQLRGHKNREFPVGTVAKVNAGDRVFYMVAMSKWNEHGNAYSTPQIIDEALDNVWIYLAERAELGDIAVPMIGTGRGRIQLPRKKVIERIAQSFVYASMDRVFSKKLTIVISPFDAAGQGINLFEVRDYLVRSLHV